MESVYKEETIIKFKIDINKSNSIDKGLVSGWASVSLNTDGTPVFDWEGDIISPDVLEKAAINFMLESRESGEMHEGENSVGSVVESIVLTKEKQKAIGIPEGVVPEGWFVTVKLFNKEVIDKVKDGSYKMFSIQGKAKRIKI